MKKWMFALMAVLVVMSMLVAACGPAETEVVTEPTAEVVAEPTAETAEPVTITVWHQWSGDYLTAIEQAFKDYTAEHPNVTIDLSKPEDTSNALSVAIPAGEGPDIIGWANDQIGTQALAGNIVALNDYGVDLTFLNTTYEPAAVRGVVWQDKIWGLPESQEGIAFVYNKALVTDEYLPTDPMDFDDLLAKAQAFNTATGKYLVCNQALGNPDAYHAAPIYFGFGVPEYVDDQGNAYLNTPEALAAGNWLVEFSKVAPAETSHDICKAMIVDGEAGAWWTGPWAIADLEAAGIDYGILPMGKPFVGIKALMLSKNAVDRGNEALAIDIMKYFTSGPVQAKIAATNKTIPASTAAMSDAAVQALATLKGFGASLNLGVPMANTPFANAQWGPVGDATTAIWTGAQAPEAALAAAQTAIETAIMEMGGPAGAEAPAEEPAAEFAGTISIWHQWSGDYLTAIEQAFNDYTAEHPNVTIDLSKPEDTSNALSVAIPAGEGPDIIGWANDQIGTQALAGNIVALNDYGVDLTFLNTTYEPAAVRGVVWQDKIWGLPESQEGIAFVYNKALVTDEYLPTDPMDFDDLLAKAQAFNTATGKYLVCNQALGNPDAYHAAPIYFGFGVPEYVDDQGNAYLNTPEALAAGNWLVEFSKVAPAETSHDICKAMIVDGEAGAWWTGPWAIADLEAAGIDYGILPMGKPFVGIKALMLSKNAVDRGNEALAIDIMKYFTSGPVQAKIAATNKTIPASTAAMSDAAVQALATLKGFGASLNLGVPMANTPFANAQWGPVGDATTAIWTGAQTPEEALAAGQTAIEEAIAAMK
ncbi:MAG TPA: extracellular solute-binding protein [Anaerolineae bacterium]|nr:extracellular solute-binding protein [Anaerolineae bacterium]